MYCMSISTSTTNSLSDDSLGIVTTNASVHENNNAWDQLTSVLSSIKDGPRSDNNKELVKSLYSLFMSELVESNVKNEDIKKEVMSWINDIRLFVTKKFGEHTDNFLAVFDACREVVFDTYTKHFSPILKSAGAFSSNLEKAWGTPEYEEKLQSKLTLLKKVKGISLSLLKAKIEEKIVEYKLMNQEELNAKLIDDRQQNKSLPDLLEFDSQWENAENTDEQDEFAEARKKWMKRWEWDEGEGRLNDLIEEMNQQSSDK